MKAIDWRGNAVDPAKLLARYRMRIDPAPTHGWHVVELRETSGRPELRNIVLSTTEPVLFDWLNVGAIGLKSEMKRDMATGIEENTLNLTASVSSYYRPTLGQDGPNSVKVQGASDVVHGWGMALDLPDQPPKDDDNRYQTLIVVWQYGTSATPTPEPPVTPPAPGVGINRADVLAIRANLVASRDAAINGIAYIDRILSGEP